MFLYFSSDFQESRLQLYSAKWFKKRPLRLASNHALRLHAVGRRKNEMIAKNIRIAKSQRNFDEIFIGK